MPLTIADTDSVTSEEGTIGEDTNMPSHNGNATFYSCGFLFRLIVANSKLKYTHRRPSVSCKLQGECLKCRA